MPNLINKTILVTGGAGYVGSHVAVQLLNAGAKVIVFDNLCNSDAKIMQRIEKLGGKAPIFIVGDIRDSSALRDVFTHHTIDAVMHFAGLKAVGQSEIQPLIYYDNNVNGSTSLFKEMAIANVQKIIFSSSATVYGNPGTTQYRESTPLNPMNVYGRTKLMVEHILRDLKSADPAWGIAILRYFNPVGAHTTGLIGENPLGTPDNLMPFISQVASGRRKKLSIFGNDYPTPDGTGLRDYIHVEDLAKGHLAALEYLYRDPELLTMNLGSGKPHSVLEVVHTFEKVTGKPIPYEILGRRPGDLAEFYADPTLARKILGWTAPASLEKMCEDAWRWESVNSSSFSE